MRTLNNPIPSRQNTFDPETCGEYLGHVNRAIELANTGHKPFMIWNDRVYVTSSFMYDTGYDRKDLV